MDGGGADGRQQVKLTSLPTDVLQKIVRDIAVNDNYFRYDEQHDRHVWDGTAFTNVQSVSLTCRALRQAVLHAPTGLRFLSISGVEHERRRAQRNQMPLHVALKYPRIALCQLCCGKALYRFVRQRAISQLQISNLSRPNARNLPPCVTHLAVSPNYSRDQLLPFLQCLPLQSGAQLRSLSVSSCSREIELIALKCRNLQMLQIDLSHSPRHASHSYDVWLDALPALASLHSLDFVQLLDRNCFSDSVADFLFALHQRSIALQHFHVHVGIVTHKSLHAIAKYAASGLARAVRVLIHGNICSSLVANAQSLLAIDAVTHVCLPSAVSLINACRSFPYQPLQVQSLHLPMPQMRYQSDNLLSWITSSASRLRQVLFVSQRDCNREWLYLHQNQPSQVTFRILERTKCECLKHSLLKSALFRYSLNY